MNLLSLILMFIISFMAYSCSGTIDFPFKEGTCVKEKDVRYVASTEPARIYKVQKITRSHVEIASYNNFGWYVDKKPHDYLDNTKYFAYNKIDCPDGGPVEKGINAKIRTIEFK